MVDMQCAKVAGTLLLFDSLNCCDERGGHSGEPVRVPAVAKCCAWSWNSTLELFLMVLSRDMYQREGKYAQNTNNIDKNVCVRERGGRELLL